MERGDVRKTIVDALEYAVHISRNPRFAHVAKDPDADLEFRLLEMDSLSIMEVCSKVEDDTGVLIDLEHILIHPTLDKLTDFVTAEQLRKSA